MKASLFCVLVVAACGGGSGTADGPGSGATPDCTTYCSTIMGACTATHSQYGSMANCMDSCKHFTVGTSGQMSGDTLGCRSYHATAAMSDPVTHCIHAGPTGGGVCGMPCQGFCDIATAVCPTQYPDSNSCMTACGGFATTPEYNATIMSGNSFACRMYHDTAAATDPTTHCPHIVTASAVCQ
jgi:hypothetical protein